MDSAATGSSAATSAYGTKVREFLRCLDEAVGAREAIGAASVEYEIAKVRLDAARRELADEDTRMRKGALRALREKELVCV